MPKLLHNQVPDRSPIYGVGTKILDADTYEDRDHGTDAPAVQVVARVMDGGRIVLDLYTGQDRHQIVVKHDATDPMLDRVWFKTSVQNKQIVSQPSREF